MEEIPLREHRKTPSCVLNSKESGHRRVTHRKGERERIQPHPAPTRRLQLDHGRIVLRPSEKKAGGYSINLSGHPAAAT